MQPAWSWGRASRSEILLQMSLQKAADLGEAGARVSAGPGLPLNLGTIGESWVFSSELGGVMVGSTSNLSLRQLCPSCSKEGAMGWWEEGLKRAAGWKHIRVVINGESVIPGPSPGAAPEHHLTPAIPETRSCPLRGHIWCCLSCYKELASKHLQH